ncbi:MAG TPA: ABC transporter ATP-binding protein [Blastocatellia bacterium]|nr:ABC transporter ATP-binding protein [Blastocatellia bacterium]
MGSEKEGVVHTTNNDWAPEHRAVATGPKALLRAEGLTKRYDRSSDSVVVFQDLDVQIAEGEMVAIVGPSGAGKSTLLHLLGGLDRPTAGTVKVDKFDIFELGDVDLARFRNREVGFIFQLQHLLPEFTAVENAMMPLLVRRTAKKEARQLAELMLESVGLSDRLTHRPGELSGGEQARVALARALVTKPRLLLGDEPTGNLDSKTSETVHGLLRDVHRSHNLTSVIVTHNERLASICDRVLHLENGKLYGDAAL